MASSAPTKTPERQLSKALRQTLRLMRQGKTPSEIAKRRKITTNAVYAAFRSLETKGYGDEVRELRDANGKASGNGKAKGRTPGPALGRRAADAARAATPVESGIANAVTAVESNRDALHKTVENLEAEAEALSVQAESKREEAERHKDEVATLDRMIEAANSR